MHTSIPQSDYGGIHPELAARITAAKAVLGDFRHDDDDFMTNHGPMPHYPTWAGRLATELSNTLALLDRLVAYRPSGEAGAKYRKIFTPEARQFMEANDAAELAAWCGGVYFPPAPGRGGSYIVMPTRKGDQRAYAGDWIIRGEGGECYPVEAEVFDNTYERVEDPT